MTFKRSADNGGSRCDLLVECLSYVATVLRKYTKHLSAAARYINHIVALEHTKNDLRLIYE